LIGATVVTTISFGAQFDIGLLDDHTLAMLAGVEGGGLSDEYVIEQLIRIDTARGFNIPVSAVTVYNIVRREIMVFVPTPDDGASVAGASAAVPASGAATARPGRMERRVLISANVTALLESHFPPSADEEDIAAALEVQQLSADQGVQLLSEDPNKFFGRTTMTLSAIGATSEVSVTTSSTKPAPKLAVRDPDWKDGLPMDASTFFVMIGGVFVLTMVGGRRAVTKIMKVIPRGLLTSPRIVRARGRTHQGISRRSRRGSLGLLGAESAPGAGDPGGGGGGCGGDVNGAVDVGAVSLSMQNTHRRTGSRGSTPDLPGFDSSV
jgi:hypothetical protein